jgi:hypothetical protein
MKTGETIFTEMVVDAKNENIVMFSYPFIIKHVDNSTLMATPWLPYTKEQLFPVATNNLLTLGKLNNEFEKYYIKLVRNYVEAETETKVDSTEDNYKLKMH